MNARDLLVSPMGVLLAVFLLFSREAQADDLALVRLTRIARGTWRPTVERSVRGVPFASSIRVAARRHGLSPSLLAALVRAESNFDPRAVSSAGALGLAQLMPATARALGVARPFDPFENLDGAARYLSRQLARFDRVSLALAAYHAGPRRASRGFTTLPRETRAYVARVMRFELEYRRGGLP